ncbi:hypothetical protein ACFFX0_31965 [Citricoccus parietis]|uniref:Uncharacterized protein n=1 Tax=Citricoccus parietis TaxID=592307 RepID=A0ABV5G9C7_9MICC
MTGHTAGRLLAEAATGARKPRPHPDTPSGCVVHVTGPHSRSVVAGGGRSCHRGS